MNGAPSPLPQPRSALHRIASGAEAGLAPPGDRHFRTIRP